MSADPEFDAAWEATPIEVTSPNEQVFLRMTGDSDVQVSFAPGYRQRVSRQQVAEQLGRLGRLWFPERTRRYFELRSRLAGRTIRPGGTVITDANRRFQEGFEAIVATGSSDDGDVVLTLVALREFAVSLAPATDHLSDEALTAALRQAGERAIADRTAQIWALREAVYYPTAAP